MLGFYEAIHSLAYLFAPRSQLLLLLVWPFFVLMTACERGGLSWSSMPYLLYSLLHLFLVTGTTCFPPSVTCIFLRHSGAKYMVPRSLPVLKPLFPRLTEWPLHLGPPHQSHGPWPGCYRPLCHVIRSPLSCLSPDFHG